MTDTKYVVEHDGDILAKDLDAEEAVLFAAQYDGWGAEFFRDENGGMGLCRSTRHVGNNAWSAGEEDPFLFGENSALVDDQEAINEVSANLVDRIHLLHKMLDVRDQQDFMTRRLNAVIDGYEGETGPGEWSVSTASMGDGEGPRASLCYKWPDLQPDHPDFGNADGPWTEWGGSAMIERAGCVLINGLSDDGWDYAIVELE